MVTKEVSLNLLTNYLVVGAVEYSTLLVFYINVFGQLHLIMNQIYQNKDKYIVVTFRRTSCVSGR